MKRLAGLLLLASACLSLAGAQEIRPLGAILFVDANCSACAEAEGHLGALRKSLGPSFTISVKQLADARTEALALGVTTLPTLFLASRKFEGGIDWASVNRLLDQLRGKHLASEVTELNLAHAPESGRRGMPEITVFSDFQCPYCAALAPQLNELARTGQAVVRFKHFPLSFHNKAEGAHRAALAAQEQGKFWEMHDRIFSAPRNLDSADFSAYARQLGLDEDRFQTALASANLKARIQADIDDGLRAGVEGTPAVYINGRKFLANPTLVNLRAALSEAASAGAANVEQIPDPITLSGGSDAVFTLEWFFDVRSELTAASAATVRQLIQRTDSSRVRIIARHLPMSFHQDSRRAHEMLDLAARQGGFWTFLGLLSRQASELDSGNLYSLAMRAGLDQAKFSDPSGGAASAVDRDLARAAALAIRGTPTFVLNGKTINGIPQAGALAALLATRTEGSVGQ